MPQASNRISTAVFLVDRQLYYKFFSPVIDELIKRGFRVVCLHNYANDETRFSGLKGNQFASLIACPQFYNGQVELKIRRSDEEIRFYIASEEIDYVYALHGPDYYGLIEDCEERRSVIWIQLQHGSDSFLGGASIDKSDIFAAYSEAWMKLFSRENVGNCYFVGYPALNSIEYDAPSIRKKYGIELEKPVFVYFCGDHPKLTWLPGIFNRLWYRYIFCDDLWPRYLKFLYKLISVFSLTEIKLMQALQSYAKKKGALLIIKSRVKRVLSSTWHSSNNFVFYDETLYPSTNYELMSIADLVVCLASTAQVEAAYFGKPSVSLYPDRHKKYFLSMLKEILPGSDEKYICSISKIIENLDKTDLCPSNFICHDVSGLFGSGKGAAKYIVDLSVEHKLKKINKTT